MPSQCDTWDAEEGVARPRVLIVLQIVTSGVRLAWRWLLWDNKKRVGTPPFIPPKCAAEGVPVMRSIFLLSSLSVIVVFLAMSTSANRTATAAELAGADNLRAAVEQARQEELIQSVQRAFNHCPQSFVDGVRVDFPDGWALLRSSVTEEKLTCRFEGDSAASLERIAAEFCAALPDVGAELRAQYKMRRDGHDE